MTGLSIRPRRLRATPALRRLVAETRVHPAELVLPMFVREGLSEPVPISSMPGVVNHSLDSLRRAAVQAAEEPILQLETGGHTAICKWVGFTPDGTRLVSAGDDDDNVLRVWDVTDPTQPRFERSLRLPARGELAADIGSVTISLQTAKLGRLSEPRELS